MYPRCSHRRTAKLETSPKSHAIVPSGGVIYWHIDEDLITPDMDKYKVLFAFQQAFSKWQPHFCKAGIVFEPTSDKSKAPIVIRFMNNGDKELPAKFENNVLAYCYFPYQESLGIHSDMYLNDHIQWGEMHKRGNTSLFKVVVHELGHAFGLEHSPDKKDIMFWQYQPNNNCVITEDTQAGIKKLYDPPSNDTLKAEDAMGWFDNLLIKKVIGLLVRRGIDFITGALLASSLPILLKLGEYITEHNAEIESMVIAAILALFSIVWSFLGKKKDITELRRLTNG